MRTGFFLLFASALLLSCNEKEATKDTTVKTSKKEIVNPEAAFSTKQIWNLHYQIQAFKIASEKAEDPQLKQYLAENLTKMQQLLNDYKLASNGSDAKDEAKADEHQKELYKLTMADIKGFDNVFKLYYKDFLNKTIKDIASENVEDETLNALKNKYGNLLYEQKLYFDVQ